MRVIDNFIHPDQFQPLQDLMLGHHFPWFYNDGIVGPDDPPGSFQFTHVFYSAHGVTPDPDKVIKSDWLHMLGPLVSQLGGSGWRIKANMGPRTTEIVRNKFHIDFPNITTAVYFINTNNGWTEFQNGDKVESVANRIVIFDSNTMHTGTTCTDEKVRVLINFNYA